MTPPETLDHFLGRGARIPLAELDTWFAALPALAVDDMLGAWEGGVFDTGHPGEKMLGKLGWVGKDFASAEAVNPIVCRGPDGQRVVNGVMGAARLRLVAFRGQVTATMVYDQHPIFDHFKRIDAASVLGVMDRKGDAFPLYFWLRRLPAGR